MAKYCIWISIAKYGPRDEIIGSTAHRDKCFTTIRAARKRLQVVAKENNDYDRHTSLCRGAKFCHGTKGRIQARKSKWDRKKPSTAKSRRTERRDPIPF